MNRGNTPWRHLQPAALHWSADGAPISDRFGDVYYSRENGLEESRHVFLEGNDLPERWLQHPGEHFCIAETGFGTGLNFLLTWRAWRQAPEPRPDLHYLSIEKYPLSREDLARALALWQPLAELAEPLLAGYPGLLPGQHRLLLDGGRVRLDLWWEDVAAALPDLAGRGSQLADAWYLDGFAPARNETMWNGPLLRAVGALSKSGASLSTFTVAGQVRRDLAGAGFEVHKAPGYGRKRECLRGVKAHDNAPATVDGQPGWDLVAEQPARPQRALVLGGGLAGCTAAAALARRGIQVTLLERAELAGAASGNEQGVLYTRLSRKHSPLVDFALQGFHFASNYYRQMFDAEELVRGLDGALCGSFQQCADSAELASMTGALAGLEELATVVAPDRASELLGIEQPAAGFWYPGSGWLHPPAVCRALARRRNIEVMEHCGEVQLHTTADGWQARSGDHVLATADCAVVAAGTGSPVVDGLDWLPFRAIRGQTTQLPAVATPGELRAVLCHKGYVPPAREGSHCIGATFDTQGTATGQLIGDHRDNLDHLAAAVPAWQETLAALDPASLTGRVGFRCASPDYLPVVGPVPDLPAFLADFAGLRSNARSAIPRRGRYRPGLYLSTAHGSRGLTSTPLAAELLASAVCAEPPPLARELCRALAPGRFIIRDLSRNRI